jgi:predicted GTPase
MPYDDARPDIDSELQALSARSWGLGEDWTPRSPSLVALSKIQKRWQTPRAVVVCVGAISAGKSTLINALLGERLLPTDSRAWTSTMVELVHSQAFEAKAFVTTPGDEQTAVYDVRRDELEWHLCEGGSESVSKRYGRGAVVLHVTIGMPCALLRSGVVLMDTPGVGGLKAAHINKARAALSEADAVIFVRKPGEPISASERRFLADASEGVALVIIVSTHRDDQPKADETLQDDLEVLRDDAQWFALLDDRERATQLAERFRSKSVVGVSVSSTTKLEVEDESGSEREGLLADSNFAVLEENLQRGVVREVGTLHRLNLARLCELVDDGVCGHCRTLAGLLSGDEDAEHELEQREAALARWLGSGAETWESLLRVAQQELERDLRKLAETRKTELNGEYRPRAQRMTLREIREEVGPTLRDVPGAVYGEMIGLTSTRLSKAVEDIRVLLSDDNVDSMLAEWEASRQFEGRVRTVVGSDRDGVPWPEVARWAPAGGLMGVGVYGLLAGGGWVAAGIPLFWPALAGAAFYGLFARWQARRTGMASGAILMLEEVNQMLTNEVLSKANVDVSAAVTQLKDQIRLGLSELQKQAVEDREVLRERNTYAQDPNRRRQRIEQLTGAAETAEGLAATARDLSARISPR